MARYTLTIDKDSPLHKRLISRLSSRISLAQKGQSDQLAKWEKAENTVLGYVPESDADALRRSARESDGTPKFTTIQLPYSYAVLMSAHTYLTSVFFARSPVHQYSGRHGEGDQQVQALEALIGYQVDVGEMMVPYYIWVYDACKYGCGILGQYWDVKKIHYGQLVEMEDPDNPGKMAMFQATHEIEGYRGNCVYNVRPSDFLNDPRVPLGQFQKGEFCAVKCRLSWNDVVRRQDAGYYMNVKELKDHVQDRAGNQSPNSASASQLVDPIREAWLQEDHDPSGTNKAARNPAVVSFWEFYIELIPNEWGVGDTNFPQKWCFTITEDLGLIVGASPLGYVHGKFPFDVLESEVEAYGLYNRGLLEILEPIQNTLDWLLNSHFYNVRATMMNQFIVDPSKLVLKDVENGGPGFIWRLRPEAFGGDIDKMFRQVPVQDVTRGHMADMPTMIQFGERALGVNDQIMGMLAGGGRKTATEVRTSTGFGVNRMKTMSEYMSASGFSSHSQKLVQSSQQFYDQSAKLRIVGDLALEAGEAFMNVTPQMIAGFYNFVPVDGTLPVDRMAQANLWKEFMATMARSPQLLQGWDLQRLMSWVFTLVGPKNVNRFKIQVLPDQQLQMQAQAGNVIPMPGRGPSGITPGGAASTAAGLPALSPPTNQGA